MNVTTSKASYIRPAYSPKRNSLQRGRGVFRGHYKRDISRLQVWREEQKPVKKILGISDHPDERGVSELADQSGANEEEYLLSDIEGEISDASKAVPEKRKQAERKNTEYEHNKSIEIDASEIPHIIQIIPVDSTCMQCKVEQPCTYRYTTKESETIYLCSQTCANSFQRQCVSQYSTHKKYLIEEIVPKILTCSECEEIKSCYFYCNYDGEHTYYCSKTCLNSMMADDADKYVFKKRSFIEVEQIAPKGAKCCVCNVHKKCSYSLNSDGETLFICANSCMKTLNGRENGRYVITGKQIEKQGNIPWYNPRTSPRTFSPRNVPEENDRYMIVRKATRKQIIVPRNVAEENGKYMNKKKITPRKQPTQSQNPSLLTLKVICNATDKYLDEAYKIQAKTPAMVERAREERERTLQAAREERERTFIRMCYRCQLILNIDEKLLTWENMDFCSELCLERYQNKIGARCANCKNNVQKTSLGKYCVRFGFDIRQFCTCSCLEEFKKGLKICHYCQQDTSVSQSFLAPVGDKGQFKDFCSQDCIKKFDLMSKNHMLQPVWAKCAVCSLEKATSIEVDVREDSSQRLCSDTCFTAFKFVNNIVPDQCRLCNKYFERKYSNFFTIYEGATAHCFCSNLCMNVYINNSRHVVPCNWCQVKKYNFDMIRRVQTNGQAIMVCSLNCLNLYQVSVSAVSSIRTQCDLCKKKSQVLYHLTMSDASLRNFCSYQCVLKFQGNYSKYTPSLIPSEAIDEQKAAPTGSPRRMYPAAKKTLQVQQRPTRSLAPNVQSSAAKSLLKPVITEQNSTCVQQPVPEPEPPVSPEIPLPPKSPTPPPPQSATPPPLQSPIPPPPQSPIPSTPPSTKTSTPPSSPQSTKTSTPVIPTPPPAPRPRKFKIIKIIPSSVSVITNKVTKPIMESKSVSCGPEMCSKECQTDPSLERRVLIPVPVPIYVPVPCAMWSLPFPVPVPIPIPIPTPVFIPTTRNSAKGIKKEIEKIQDKKPPNPFEAELLTMAEMVACDMKNEQSDSDSDEENAETLNPVADMGDNNAFGEDMLQVAFKMATNYEDKGVDLESEMLTNTITPDLRASVGPRKRAPGAPKAARSACTTTKRRRAEPPPAPLPDPPREPAEKPDANMCLKYMFGVNAWKQWVMTKNAEIETSSIRRKPFKSEILQLTADELNYSLCLFVKEVRKPNGSEYAPDTIYYLVLGIQQYLFENGRIDNIFSDPYYEEFTDCLDEVARQFAILYDVSNYVVTRVEEEHLWESKQLGAHSPHVLLTTLMFYNTKYFNLVTVEDHSQLSLGYVLKHRKLRREDAMTPDSRNDILRYYPPQFDLEPNLKKKKRKVYEQRANEANPFRCPIKLFEFYISKCPESVRTRNDVFYLQPERSCVPDSPVWYSTQALSRQALAKMLHRVKMVKEINIALLTS